MVAFSKTGEMIDVTGVAPVSMAPQFPLAHYREKVPDA